MILAGCTGGGEASGQGLTPADTAQAGDGLGSIAGLVVDGETNLLRGVEVAIISTGNTTTSDDEGKFTFNGLEPGNYQLVAQKLGYESLAKNVAVVADEISEVDFTLQQIDVTEPFTTVEIGDGLITCAIGTPAVTVYPDAILGICGQVLMLQDKRSVSFFLGTGVEETYSEIVWEPTQNVFGSALWAIQSVDGDGVGDVSGESPLVFHESGIDDDADEDTEFDHFFWAAGGQVDESNPGRILNVHHEQRLTIYFSEFYHQEMVEGYTAVPE